MRQNEKKIYKKIIKLYFIKCNNLRGKNLSQAKCKIKSLKAKIACVEIYSCISRTFEVFKQSRRLYKQNSSIIINVNIF